MCFLSALEIMLFERELGDIKEYKMWAAVAGDTSWYNAALTYGAL